MASSIRLRRIAHESGNAINIARAHGPAEHPRIPEGTLERIDAALKDGEKRSDLIREAVEKELKRRKA